MRITRDTLLKIARDTAAQRLRVDRQIIAIYLTGSCLTPDPLLGGTADIDLFIIHPGEPAYPREIVRLTDEVHLDIAHLPQSEFQQPRQLRIHPWLGPFIYRHPMVLHDTSHWFDFNQASLTAQFNIAAYVIQRARPLAESARQGWLSLHGGLDGADQPATLRTYLGALENAANAVALLSGLPMTERRFLLAYPDRTKDIGRPGLYAGLLDLLGYHPIPDATWSHWAAGWQAAVTAAGALPESPARLKPARLPYYLRSMTAIREVPEQAEAALWPLLTTWTRAVELLPAETEGRHTWQEALSELELDAAHFESRLTALDAYLDMVDETLDVWGQKNGA